MNWKIITALFVCCVMSSAPASAQSPDQGRVITSEHGVLYYRDRPAAENPMVEDRLKNLLPRLMEETDIDMWLVINR